MEYTKEQIKAACALNLCTVSVSQIIEYEDIQIMEQEYEAILNNLNLEQMPKDEALLNILKQILDTITYFRIEDGDKQFLDREYQQKMKHAIWSAVPNIGMIVAGGNPVTMAVSLASQVGIGYMNYRKAKADAKLQLEKDRWQLERTAIEQFNGLRRELFDTAWRLSAAHNFPDRLRLTERQIKQYNAILMDTDLLRKYERLTVIRDAFLAYPPFWYHYGNTANAIAGSGLNLSTATRVSYRLQAKEHFLHYRQVNDHALLREDPVSASCALELMDLLSPGEDRELILELAREAIAFSGRSNDVLQLAALSYLRLNEPDHAAQVLRQLVNEQYNTVLNAQLLSSIYVSRYLSSRDPEIRSRYEILSNQVGTHYLYPMPRLPGANLRQVEESFLATQKKVLWGKYHRTLENFLEKYTIRYGKLLPVPDPGRTYPDSYFLATENALQIRKYDIAKVFASRRRKAAYCEELKDAELVFGILDLLNDLFDGCCRLEVMTDDLQSTLFASIEEAIVGNRAFLNGFQKKLEEDELNMLDMENLLQMSLKTYTEDFFRLLSEALHRYVDSLREMQDFAAAEENLAAFCAYEGLADPVALFEARDDTPPPAEKRRFDDRLLGREQVVERADLIVAQSMASLIYARLPEILNGSDSAEVYFSGSPELEQYFRSHKLSGNNTLIAHTLAVLDDLTPKGDHDLIFTTYGIVPVKSGLPRSVVRYSEVNWVCNKKQECLVIDGKFELPGVDSRELFELCVQLRHHQQEIPAQDPLFKLPEGFNLFKKND